MQKMARDRLRAFLKSGHHADADDEEEQLCLSLAKALKPAKGDKVREAELWDEHWLTVYALAEATMQRTMREMSTK
jgi:hypothetical protein